MSRGDHLLVRRPGGYEHHAIDRGDAAVIHYTAADGTKRSADVRVSALCDVARGGVIEVVTYASSFTPNEVIARAESRLGEQRYHLLWNNCESFARWCKTGEPQSEQVQRVTSTLFGGTGAAVTASAGLGVASAYMAPALIGAAQTSATLAAVGGSMISGVAVLSCIPAGVAVAAFHLAMADDPALPALERNARAAGRKAATWGAVGTVGAGILAIAIGGAGLGAAGTVSMLKMLGAALGGGMASGVTVIGGGAAAVGAAFGWRAYKRAGGGLSRIPLAPPQFAR